MRDLILQLSKSSIYSTKPDIAANGNRQPGVNNYQQAKTFSGAMIPVRPANTRE
ncbi:hypothetical protein [Raoultella ornithinolytica]|uniref:hypothetical protein n=1 Tax=Raoultella ornithinolytica TaxID=54291 RepID=UPI001586E96C|nr:hypothetical protein [Raoultella ornithinolytica]